MKKIITILLAVILAVTIASPVFGIADPDSPLQISDVYVYENCLEEGDIGVLLDYYIDYAVPPTETANEAFLGVFVDTDGVTQLGSVAPYAYDDDGYGRGLMWIYFSAADVVTYGIDSADELLYDIWFTGNPTLAWAGDPPKTITGITYWQPDGTSTATLVALRVLYYAQVLENVWAVDMIESTALGNRLTTTGEDYFQNVITNLREIAPNCFASSESTPTTPAIDYSTDFEAMIEDGTGTLAVSPDDLVAGTNTVTVNVDGTFTLTLSNGTEGTVTGGTATVVGDPVTVVAGVSTITTNGGVGGTMIIELATVNAQSILNDTILGTAFDLTDLANLFGISVLFVSGFVWFLISILICWATLKATNNTKLILIVFDICIIGGSLLGMMSILVSILMFIAFGAFTAYILFFRPSNV